MLGGTEVEEVYVLAPMASTEPTIRSSRSCGWSAAAALVTLPGPAGQALAAQGKRVTVLTPGPADLAAMGINLMDPRRSGRAGTVVPDLGRGAGPAGRRRRAGGVTPRFAG